MATIIFTVIIALLVIIWFKFAVFGSCDKWATGVKTAQSLNLMTTAISDSTD